MNLLGACQGSLASFNLTQLYAKAGNVLIPNVTWQLGTLDTYFGDHEVAYQVFFDQLNEAGGIAGRRSRSTRAR